MEKEELLLAFSELMDKKLDVLRIGLEEKIDDTNERIDNVNQKIDEIVARLDKEVRMQLD